MSYFPLMIEVEDREILVIGGGKIAFHKIKILLTFGATIRVVSEEFCDDLKALANINVNNLTMVKKSFDEKDIDNCEDICFVIAATDDEKLQSIVSELCRIKKIPVNVVDKKEKSSFYFPAVIKRDELVVAVSTGGNSPVAAGFIKREIDKKLPKCYGKLVSNLGKYRDVALLKIDSYDKRKQFFLELIMYGTEHDGDVPDDVVKEKLSEYQTDSCERSQ